MTKIRNIQDVAERHMCCGCGMCAVAQPGDIRIVDDLKIGRRPVVRPGADTASALNCCPGIQLEQQPDAPPGADETLWKGWGPVLELWEGYATDPDLRYRGSSGGVTSALAACGVVDDEIGGAIQIRQRSDQPLLNETVLSTSVDEVKSCVGSRYAPASPCDGLGAAIERERPVVFVGKPCDVAAIDRARPVIDGLDASVAVTVAIFCAGAPSTAGTLEMLDRMGVSDWRAVTSLRYRGHGWPGTAAVRTTEDPGERTLTYDESWGGVLERHRPWRCRLCIDHTGEFADLAVGDPWYRPIAPGEHGSSLIVVRTERGRQFLEQAMRRGLISAERVDHSVLERSQPNLLTTRGAVWGRMVASRFVRMPVPRYINMSTRSFWWKGLSLSQKVRSFTGTVRRIVRRRLHRRVVIEPATALDPDQTLDW